jgi:predicted amidohydrolase YtcJ
MTLERIRSMRHSFSHGTMLGKVPEVVETALKYNLYLPVDVGRSLIDETEAIEEFYGPEGFEFQAPIRSLIDAGVEVLSDTAGFDDVEVIVTRAHPNTGVVYGPEERVDRVTAIKLSLIQAAKFNMAEDLTGTLEPGKYADFIVIDRDFLDTVAVPDDEIADIRVLMTNIGGEVVWTADNAPAALKQLPHFWD